MLSIERQMLLSWLSPVLKRSNFARCQSVNLVLQYHLQGQEVIFWRAFWFQLPSHEEEDVFMPLGINAGRVSLIVCSNTFGHNWTLTSNNDFVLITKAGTFLLIYAEIHSSQTTIIAARLSQVGRVLIYWAQGRASQPFAASEEKWRRSLIPMGYNTRLNLKSSLIVSRLPSCYAG